jgi:predicted negative regulator of RcsB-dependent stress response
MLVSVVLLFGVAQESTTSELADPRVLYEQAALLLEKEPGAPAVRLLERLVEDHSETYYAEIAALHLAECYVLLDEPLRGFKLLEEWQDRLRFPSKPASAIAPELYQRAQVVRTQAARAAACIRERQGDFLGALQLLQSAAQSADDAETQRIAQEIFRVAVHGCSCVASNGETVESLLAAIESRQQLQVRFAVAEKLIQQGDYDVADRQLEWLSTHANEQAGVRPEWALTVDLRRCELAVQRKQYLQAREHLAECREDYSDSKHSYEFDFLLARCAVAQIDFDEAIRILRQIAAEESVPAEGKAKAYWMEGEVYFLMEAFVPAIEAYRQAADINAPAWQARALLQMAKCQELSQQTAEAIQSYQRLQDEYAHLPETSQASVRIAHLREVTVEKR